MLITGFLVAGVSMGYEEQQQMPTENEEIKKWRERAAYTYWICDLCTRLFTGLLGWLYTHKMSPSWMILYSSITCFLGSGILFVVSIFSPEQGFLYPTPSMFFGTSNGALWMVGSQMLIIRFGQKYFGRIWAFMFLANGLGFIMFSFLAVLLPFKFLWAIVYGTASTGSVVLASLTVKHYRDLEALDPKPETPSDPRNTTTN